MSYDELDFDPEQSSSDAGDANEIVQREEGITQEVLRLLRHLGYSYDMSYNAYERDHERKPRAYICNKIKSVKDSKMSLAAETVDWVLEDHETLLKQEAKDEVRHLLNAYDSKIGETELRRWVGFLQRREPQNVSHLDVYALASTIWQVKRKFAGHYSLENPLMLFFSGGQGAGKGRIIDRLFEPVEAWTAGTMSFKAFRDRASKNTYNEYYVLPFNDVGTRDLKAEHLEELKSLVTDRNFQHRKGYGSGQMKLDNIATLIGSANYSVNQLIQDDTGARRWWEIVVPDVGWSPEDEKTLASLNPKRLWCSVNGGTVVNPRSRYIKEYAAIQNDTMKARTPLQDALEDLFIPTGDPTHEIDEKTLHKLVKNGWDADDGRLVKGELWVAALKLAPLLIHGGHSTCTNRRYVFRGLKVR